MNTLDCVKVDVVDCVSSVQSTSSSVTVCSWRTTENNLWCSIIPPSLLLYRLGFCHSSAWVSKGSGQKMSELRRTCWRRTHYSQWGAGRTCLVNRHQTSQRLEHSGRPLICFVSITQKSIFHTCRRRTAGSGSQQNSAPNLPDFPYTFFYTPSVVLSHSHQGSTNQWKTNYIGSLNNHWPGSLPDRVKSYLFVYVS